MSELKATIREYFGLKAPSFMLVPKTDYECYAGRTEEKSLIADRIGAAADVESAAKLVLWGVYGGGKTHTQFYAGRKLLSELGIDSVYIDCPDLEKNSTFLDLYKEIMMSIGSDTAKSILQPHLLRVGDAQFRQFFGNQDVAAVCVKLVLSSPGSEDQTRAWRWLVGEQVGAAESIALGATAALTSREAARLLARLGEIYGEAKARKLVILIDELEKLENVTDPHGLETFETAFRELAEKLQRHLGFICACTAGDYDAIPGPLARDAVSSRIGEGNYIPISQLKDDELKPFILELLTYVVDSDQAAKRIEELRGQGQSVSPNFYPFTEEAVEQIAAHVSEDPRNKTPRMISDLMNDAGTEAKRRGKKMIDEDAVREAIRKRGRAPRPTAQVRPTRRRRTR